MIITASSPWKNQAAARWRNFIVVMLLFIGLVASFSAIFSSQTATAQINRGDQCDSFSIIGDHQGVQDVRAGLEDRLRDDLGVKDVESQTFNGRDVKQITKQIKNSDLSGRCLIIEGGTGDLKNSDKTINKDLEKAVKEIEASGAKKVFWVSPVVDDARAGKDYKTKNFNDALSEIEGGKINVINIQELSVRGNLFEDNGVTMNEEGYKERVNLIIKKIKPLVDDPDKSSSSSSSPSDSPGNNGNNNGGDNGTNNGGNSGGSGSNNGNGGWNEDVGAGSQPSGAESGLGTEPIDQGDGVEDGDISNSSPLAISRAIPTYGRSNASQFLVVNRWGGFDISSSDFRPDNISGALISSMSAMMANTLFNFAQFIFSLVVNSLMFVVSDSLPTVGIKIANAIFSAFIGGTNDRNKVIPIATGLVTIAFVFSLITALDTKIRMTPKQRVLHVASSVARVMMATTVFLFVSYQSGKNHNPETTSDLISKAANESESGEVGDIDLENSQWETRERRAGDFSSWVPLSLGWFLSLGYYLGNQAAGAGFNIGSALIIYPIESLASSMESEVNSDDEVRPACDRYIDSINLAFRGTAFAEGSPALTSVLSSLDATYVKLILKPYSYLWGGSTIQSSNTYCRDFENSASRPAGEILLMARGAGMWKEAAGSGNIIKSKQAALGRYANGKHMSASDVANVSDGLPTGLNGILVDSEGNWQANNDSEYNALRRAENFLRGGVDKSTNQADPGLYYFASCIWRPKRNNAFLDSSMDGVYAMGATGVAEQKTGLPPAEVEMDIDEGFKKRASISQGIVGGVEGVSITGDKANEFFDNVAQAEEGKGKKVKIPSPNRRVMYNSDCQNPFVFNLDNVSSDALSGWNSKNQWAERWDFTPPPPPSLTDSIKSAAVGSVQSSIKNAPVIKGVLKHRDKVVGFFSNDDKKNDDNSSDDNSGDDKGAEEGDTLKQIDPDDNPRLDPKAAFSGKSDSTGHNVARSFWEYRAGERTDGVSVFVSMIAVNIAICILLLLFIPALLLAVVNLIFTLFLVSAGGVMAMGLILMAFRSAKPKDAR